MGSNKKEVLYRVHKLQVIDGDTVKAEINLGFGLTLQHTVRLEGLNAPEVSEPAGLKCKEYLVKLLTDSAEVFLEVSPRKEKYGRVLGSLLTNEEMNINEKMIQYISSLKQNESTSTKQE